jgi:predicted nicotinamide N-methyase
MEVNQSEQHAVTHTMSLVAGNSAVIKVRELPITRADNPFGTEVAPEDDTTGLAIWPASIILARWVAENREVTKDKVVVELGAGCGLPGLSAAVYGGARSVYLTDIHEPSLSNAVFNARLNLNSEGDNHVFKLPLKDPSSPFIDEVFFLCSKFEDSLNIQSEKTNVVRTANVSWQDKSSYPPEAADVILGSDLVYDSNILSLLVPAISGMLLTGGSFLYVAPDTGRDGMDGLHDALIAANFECLIRTSCPADLYSNPLVNTGDNDAYDMFILHFYDMSIKKPHTLFQYRKINLI